MKRKKVKAIRRSIAITPSLWLIILEHGKFNETPSGVLERLITAKQNE